MNIAKSFNPAAPTCRQLATPPHQPDTPRQVSNRTRANIEGHRRERTASALAAALLTLTGGICAAQPAPGPAVVDPNLKVTTVVTNLQQPIAMAFLDDQDFLVTEKASGKVKRVVDGVVTTTVLDLPVNSGSERGLLGIALHPGFKRNHWVYLYWTESSTNTDTTALADVGNPDSPFAPGTPRPLGNRVDRFVWDPETQALTFDRNLITLRAYQADAGQPLRGNHDGGVICFQKHDDDAAGDQDGVTEEGWRDDSGHAKLFIVIGDNGRRGVMQNLIHGPVGPGIPDDQFGGPEPDNNHLTGVVLRLNDDGTTPEDNPFFELGKALGGEAGANIQKVFAYGIRNSFGLAVDPRTGRLWESENCDDAFDEMNHIEPGHNGGWIQIMGPVERVSQFKAIETSPQFFGLQQIRWSPTNIADTAVEARSRLVDLPGSHYAEPEFSWKFATAPAAIGFMRGTGLGQEYNGDLFVGASRTALASGYLFRFRFDHQRRHFKFADPRLLDLVADNTNKFDVTESESLLFGAGFGIGTDIRTGPNGNLYVVSTSNGAVYEISRVSRGRGHGRPPVWSREDQDASVEAGEVSH